MNIIIYSAVVVGAECVCTVSCPETNYDIIEELCNAESWASMN